MTSHAAGHRLPDLSVLPPLLAETGSFATIRERLGSPAISAASAATPASWPCRTAPSRTSLRHWRSTSGSYGSPARRSAIRVAEEPGLARRAGAGRRAGSADGAGLRAQRARRRQTAARSRPWRRGGTAECGSWSPASRPCSSTIAPDDLPAEPRELRVGGRLHQDALLRDLFHLGYTPVTEVAGRGEFARRGGIVDVFPPSMDLPIGSSSSVTRSIRSVFDPTDQRTTGKVDRSRAPARVRVPPPDGSRGHPRAAGPSGVPTVGAARRDLARLEGTTDDPLRPTCRVPAARRVSRPRGRRRRRGVGALSRPGDRASITSTRHDPDP